MRVAIIGSGISGLTCARLLCRSFDVTVFEADHRIGGHTNTVWVHEPEQTIPVDTGFIVFNDRTYPVFSQLLADLNVTSSPTSMSFSVRSDRSGLEYNGTSLNGLFAQRRNLTSLSFLRMLKDIARFNRRGIQDAEAVSNTQTVDDYLAQHAYSKEFAEDYLLPMGAAIWSCPRGQFGQFPIRFILEFYRNHGLLSLWDRPVWKTIDGGSVSYVERLIEPFSHRIRTGCPVMSVDRRDDHVVVNHGSDAETFDEVIFACHSDQALRMLSAPDPVERELLESFPYSSSVAVLHTDESVLPRCRRAWASWNYHIGSHETVRPTVTYNMNLLQRIDSKSTYCVTLNEQSLIDPAKILQQFQYSHPVFSIRRDAAQSRHPEVIRRRGISYCGAYWRNGFHEDGVVSALAVCRRFGIAGWSPAAVANPSATRISSIDPALVGE